MDILSLNRLGANPPVDPVPFGHWTLRDEAAQRRSPARWASHRGQSVVFTRMQQRRTYTMKYGMLLFVFLALVQRVVLAGDDYCTDTGGTLAISETKNGQMAECKDSGVVLRKSYRLTENPWDAYFGVGVQKGNLSTTEKPPYSREELFLFVYRSKPPFFGVVKGHLSMAWKCWSGRNYEECGMARQENYHPATLPPLHASSDDVYEGKGERRTLIFPVDGFRVTRLEDSFVLKDVKFRDISGITWFFKPGTEILKWNFYPSMNIVPKKDKGSTRDEQKYQVRNIDGYSMVLPSLYIQTGLGRGYNNPTFLSPTILTTRKTTTLGQTVAYTVADVWNYTKTSDGNFQPALRGIAFTADGAQQLAYVFCKRAGESNCDKRLSEYMLPKTELPIK